LVLTLFFHAGYIQAVQRLLRVDASKGVTVAYKNISFDGNAKVSPRAAALVFNPRFLFILRLVRINKTGIDF